MHSLVSMIQKSEKDGEPCAPEEKERETAFVYEVSGYCRNDVVCRRVQVLRYFDEKFKPEDCHQMCDNCRAPGVAVTVDVTTAAKDIVRLTTALAPSRVTKQQCLQAFEGRKTKTVREKGLDQQPLYGAGRTLDKGLADRLFEELIERDLLSTYSLANSLGFHNDYLRVIAT